MIKFKVVGKYIIGIDNEIRRFKIVIGKGESPFNYKGIWIHLYFINFWIVKCE